MNYFWQWNFSRKRIKPTSIKQSTHSSATVGETNIKYDRSVMYDSPITRDWRTDWNVQRRCPTTRVFMWIRQAWRHDMQDWNMIEIRDDTTRWKLVAIRKPDLNTAIDICRCLTIELDNRELQEEWKMTVRRSFANALTAAEDMNEPMKMACRVYNKDCKKCCKKNHFVVVARLHEIPDVEMLSIK